MAATDPSEVRKPPQRKRAAPTAGTDHDDQPSSSTGRKRTRTGCLNCRRKRRKCDEAKPKCEGCQARREACEWGVRVSFRPENAQTVDPKRYRLSRECEVGDGQVAGFQIVDVTSEVIRDYHEETHADGNVGEAGKGGRAQRVDPDPPPPAAPAERVGDRQPVLDQTGGTEVATPLPMNVRFQTGSDFFYSPGVSDSTPEDGIFLPGSQYQELHAALRSRLIDTARSTTHSGLSSPELSDQPVDYHYYRLRPTPQDEDDESRRLAHLSPEQEYVLWQTYLGEIAGWLDKFDNSRHFELVLPVLAKSHPHLKYSMLALAARQKERYEKKLDYSCSLALYQHAIHLLSPLLQKRNTVVLASCVVLAVLEMLSCSPKAWRRHLDGCAALIQALNINGTRGSTLERALFWSFARMDNCGALISSEKTLIPLTKWMGGPDLASDLALFHAAEQSGRFDMYANHIVYLCGQVVDLLCTSGQWQQRSQRRSDVLDMLDYGALWVSLFEALEAWYAHRPDEMRPILTIPALENGTGSGPAASPFPTILFPNGAAISGNQSYHTAALLMLKHKPARVTLPLTRSTTTTTQHQQPPTSSSAPPPKPKPRALLWHARCICAISIANPHHGCWTNCVQPLWLAGQHMSAPAEHRAILEVYARIERETGWAAEWRGRDLREFWGEV